MDVRDKYRVLKIKYKEAVAEIALLKVKLSEKLACEKASPAKQPIPKKKAVKKAAPIRRRMAS